MDAQADPDDHILLLHNGPSLPDRGPNNSEFNSIIHSSIYREKSTTSTFTGEFQYSYTSLARTLSNFKTLG